jgi:hypothetical protein
MRLVILTVLLGFATAVPVAAQDKVKPNTLTPKEIAEGWILLFDGETPFGWRKPKRLEDAGCGGLQPSADVTVKDGTLIIARGREAYFSTEWQFFDLRAEYQADGKEIRADDFYIDYGGYPHDFHYDLLKGGRSGKWGQLSTRFAHNDYFFKDEPDGKQDASKTIRRDYPMVCLNFGHISKAEDARLTLRNTKLHPLGMKPLFNGKDLAGWKSFPGKKSEFTVEDGAIVCKNGPGDLQTEGKYANFVLQLECKSNGKHLNSGIFFRCKPNEYQNGYEAQIHNNFTADPPKEYTVEEYDPETHKLLGKKTVKSFAKDYGTGAIYRRVPARKEVAKDGEWFTMTVVAHGNHIATWVNGIQQVDWYDNRPASDNPRNGCRLEAGHISIQGHDSTTDLSFRNIRIAELPGK